jgi:hypothetical protein
MARSSCNFVVVKLLTPIILASPSRWHSSIARHTPRRSMGTMSSPFNWKLGLAGLCSHWPMNQVQINIFHLKVPTDEEVRILSGTKEHQFWFIWYFQASSYCRIARLDCISFKLLSPILSKAEILTGF